MIRDLREDLLETRAAMTAADREHRRAMIEAEERHRRSMDEVSAQLRDREATISRLEATIDALTGRRP